MSGEGRLQRLLIRKTAILMNEPQVCQLSTLKQLMGTRIHQVQIGKSELLCPLFVRPIDNLLRSLDVVIWHSSSVHVGHNNLQSISIFVVLFLQDSTVH